MYPTYYPVIFRSSTMASWENMENPPRTEGLHGANHPVKHQHRTLQLSASSSCGAILGDALVVSVRVFSASRKILLSCEGDFTSLFSLFLKSSFHFGVPPGIRRPRRLKRRDCTFSLPRFSKMYRTVQTVRDSISCLGLCSHFGFRKFCVLKKRKCQVKQNMSM